MAKGDKSGTRLPKTIAGVKVPKELRKTAERALRAAQEHPVISEIVAAGLIAAAASLMDKDKVAEVARDAGDGIEDGVNKARRATTRAKAAVKAAAGAMGAQVAKNAKGSGAAIALESVLGSGARERRRREVPVHTPVAE